MGKEITLNLITSKVFWSSLPLVIAEIAKRGYFVSIFDETNVPSASKLLDCDVLLDLSAIIDISFYEDLDKEYERRKKLGLKLPLRVDEPIAVLNSMDKRKTHKLLPEFAPESYNLDGKNNVELINNFKNDQFVIVKDPFGWQAKGVFRMSPKEAIEKYSTASDLIVQKYIPFTDGVGRIMTLNYKDDFEVMCAYLRIPKASWRTGEDDCTFKLVNVDKDLYNFAKEITTRSKIYLNAIDYIYSNGKYVMLEVNVAPGLKDPYDEFHIDTPKQLFDHIERSLLTLK